MVIETEEVMRQRWSEDLRKASKFAEFVLSGMISHPTFASRDKKDMILLGDVSRAIKLLDEVVGSLKDI